MGYTFLVVDDEGIERMALAQIIRREFPEDVRVHTLPNGIEMLRFLENQKADVAIVDIDMPGISGIEAIRKLREQKNPIKIIINTAYSNFQYAVDAIKLDVDDYLVKPLKREKLIETLRRCVDKLEAEHRQVNREKDMLNALKPAIAGTLLRAVEKNQISQENWDVYLDAMGLTPERAVIAMFGIEDWANLGNSYQQKMLDRVISMLSMEYDCVACSLIDRGIMTLIVQPPEQHRRVFYDRLQKVLGNICGTMTTASYCHTRVGVGTVVEGVLQLHTSYWQAVEALRRDPQQRVCFYDYIRQPERNTTEAEQKHPQSKAVRAACLIVRSNYRDNISLDSVAERVGVTPSYLSRLFKKEMQINFQDFLTDVRIEKAIELLYDESLSVRALASAVGYNNYTYFCKIFKRETGKTVGEYRESLGMKNQEQEEQV